MRYGHHYSYRNCKGRIPKFARINQEINLVIQHEHSSAVSEDEIKKIRSKRKIRSKIQKKRMQKQQRILSSLREKMSYMEIRLNDIAQEQGSSSWLTVLPIK